MLLSVTAQAAVVYKLPGNLPANCTGSATSYSCTDLTLAWNDSIVVVNANTTLTVSKALTINGNEINTASPAAGFVLVAKNLIWSNYLHLDGSLSTDDDVLSGSATSITGTLTTSATLTTGWNTTIGGAVSAKSIVSGGGSIYGSLTATGGVIVLGASDHVKGSLAATGNITSGSANTIDGNVSSSAGYVQLNSANTRVGGSVSAKGDVILGSGTVVTGDVASSAGGVTLGASGTQVGGNVTARGLVTLESGTRVVGSVTSSNSGVVLTASGASVGKCVTVNTGILNRIVLGDAASVGGVCCNTGGVCGNACVDSLIDWTHPMPPLCSAPGGVVQADHFNCVEAGLAASTGHLYTKLVGAAFAFDVVALKADGSPETGYASDGDKTVTVELVDGAGSAACTARSALSPAVSVSLTFAKASQAAEQGRKSASIPALGKAYADLRCRVIDANQSPSVKSCSSDDFSVRPSALTLSPTPTMATAPSASAKPTIKAGDAFTLQATTGTASTSYAGTLTQDTGKLTAQATAQDTTVQSGGAVGVLTPATLTANAAAVGASYSEVGYLYLAPGAYRDASFTAVDRASGDCISDTTSNNNLADTLVGGRYGCDIGNKSAVTFGRFVPDHFAVTPAAVSAGCNSFTYFGQDGLTTPFTLTAQNSGNATTRNYGGAYARLALTDWSAFAFTPSPALPGGSTLAASATAPSGTWNQGVASVSAKHQASRPSAPAGETALTVLAKPVDADGVTLASASAVHTASTPLRFGRLRLFNAYGSQKTDLLMPLQVEYWSGKSWVINGDDTCTAARLTTAAFALYPGGITTSASTVTLNGGSGAVRLAKPSPAASGYVDVAANLGSSGNDQSCLSYTRNPSTPAGLPWLRAQNGNCAPTYDRDPSARATFGVYAAETRKSVHIRELY